MSKLIVIVGITGNQGGSVANVFRSEPGWRIRGLTRNPSKASNAALRDAGIELVEGDLDNPASLERAFKGANAIYSVTDFWQFLQDPSTFATAEAEGKQPNEVAMARELTHGKNIVDAAAKQLATLERFVVSTLSDSKKHSKGAITWNLHFDGKAKCREYLEATYADLAKRTSYLQVGYYLDNWKTSPIYAPEKQPDGSFVMRNFAKPAGKPIPYVHPPHDTGHFVRALVLSPSAPAGSDLLGYIALITMEEYAERWGKVLGVKCRLEPLSLDEVLKTGDTPEWLTVENSETGDYVTTYGWDGGAEGVTHPKDSGVDMEKLTNLEEWIRQQDWSSVM